MKNLELTKDDLLLTKEDQNIFTLVANAQTEYSPTIDEDIRNELSDALGGLGKSIQLLIVLLEQNNIINMLPEMALPQYSEIMDNISHAAMKGVEAVLKSHEFDKSITLAVVDECSILQ